jgi:hypothetical protein
MSTCRYCKKEYRMYGFEIGGFCSISCSNGYDRDLKDLQALNSPVKDSYSSTSSSSGSDDWGCGCLGLILILVVIGGISNLSSKPIQTTNTTAFSVSANSPESLVQAYFNNIQNRQYGESWNMLPIDFQNNKVFNPRGYDSYTDWWKETGLDVDEIKLASRSKDNAVVKANVWISPKKGKKRLVHFRYYLHRKSTNSSWIISKIKSNFQR